MNPPFVFAPWFRLPLLLAALLLASCGGGGGSSPLPVENPAPGPVAGNPPQVTGPSPLVVEVPASGLVVDTLWVTLGQQVTLKVAVPNPAGVTYQWLRNAQPVANAVQASYTVDAVTVADSAAWQVLITRNGQSSFSGAKAFAIRGQTGADALALNPFLAAPAPGWPLAVDSSGNVFIRSAGTPYESGGRTLLSVNILKFGPDGQPLPFGEGGTAGITVPEDITAAAFDPADNLYLVFTRFGATTGATVVTDGPKIATGPAAPAQSSEIYKITPSGHTTLALKTQRGDANFIAPVTVASNAVGVLYLGDTEGDRVLKWNESGSFSVVGTASFKAASFQLPIGKELAVDTAGTVYLVSDNNRTVVRFNADGTSGIFAGSEPAPFTQPAGADGTGAAALFYAPASPAMDAAGNLYVTDANSLRKITPQGKVTTVWLMPDGLAQGFRNLRIGRNGAIYLGVGDAVLKGQVR